MHASPAPRPTWVEADAPPDFDVAAFVQELDVLQKEVRAETDPAENLAHLRKMDRWSKGLLALGYATAPLGPNPLSMLAMSAGRFGRWAVVAHHVQHKAYDHHAETPEHFRSEHFGQGKRRRRDWLEWMTPSGWHEEHDVLHHYRLGDDGAPLPRPRGRRLSSTLTTTTTTMAPQG